MNNTTPADQLRREIGLRLAEERVGLKLSQDQLAQAVDKTRRTVAAWEAGDQSPDALVLALASAVGVDVAYVVTGRRGNQLSEPQQLLVSYTSGMDSVAIRGALMAVRGFAAVSQDRPELLDPPGTHTTSPAYAVEPDMPAAVPTISIHGSVGQHVAGDVTAPQTFNVKTRSTTPKGGKPHK